MKSMFRLACVALLSAGPALADGAVQLPEIPELGTEASVELLTRLVVANVVSQNCEGFAISEAEYDLLAGSAGIIADRFQLDPAQYNQMFLHPAYGILSSEGGCAEEGPDIAVLLEQLGEWGGVVTPE